MKVSMNSLLGEIDGAEEVLRRTAQKRRRISQEESVNERGLERAREELYTRVLGGESTGDVLADIIIATKGKHDSHALGQLRSLMARFAKHRGQFIAGHHLGTDNFHRILVGIIESDTPAFSHVQKEIVLPIAPGVVLDSDWQYGFANLCEGKWVIKIDAQETFQSNRCYNLERFWQDGSNILIGDDVVWSFLTKDGNHRYGPIVTFTHVASALGRPLKTVPSYETRIAPFEQELRGSLPHFIAARNEIGKLFAGMAWVAIEKVVKESSDNIDTAKKDLGKNIEVMETVLKYLEKPHVLPKKR